MMIEATDLVVALVSLLFGGGGVFAWNRTRQTDRANANASATAANEQSMLSFYALWNDELKRLRKEIDALHFLVQALEMEIITLGGDPVRVRLELSKELARGQES